MKRSKRCDTVNSLEKKTKVAEVKLYRGGVQLANSEKQIPL